MERTLFGDDGGVRPRSRRRLRPLVPLLALALLPAACGGGADDRTERGTRYGGAGSAAPAASTTAPSADRGGAPTTTARPAPTTTARGRTGPTTTTGTAPDAGPGPETAPGSADVEPTAQDDGSQGPPGAFARTLLRARGGATGIVLERHAQSGATLSAAAVSHTAQVLGDVSGKAVDVRAPGTLATDDTDWSADEVRAAADGAARVAQGSDGRGVLRLLVLRGTFEGSDAVLGVTVRGDVVAVFADSVAGAATPLVSRSQIEDAVLLHEVGHALGLVDLARDTGRADKEHPGHSTNAASVMYWAVESSLVGQVLNGPPPRDFDARDLADLRALRDGA
jgi:hypothetical protein